MSTTMTDDVVLAVEDLRTYFYQDGRVNRAVDGVTFSLRRGRVLGVVGESGCGKSVTASSVMRLLPELARIESGTISFRHRGKETDIAALDRRSRELRSIRGDEIAMIFQDPMVSLNPVYSVGFQVAETLRSHRKISAKKAWDVAVGLLDRMGIPHAADRAHDYPHQFSGGMRQRVMIAMAMSCDPTVLIADEPTTALDVTIQAQVFELMSTLREDFDTAIMLITHDMGVINEIADDVVVMYMGKVVERGTKEEVLGNPQHPYTQALLRSMPVLGRGHNQELRPIAGSTPDAYNRPPGCQFAARCEFAMPTCSQDPVETALTLTHGASCWLLADRKDEAHD